MIRPDDEVLFLPPTRPVVMAIPCPVCGGRGAVFSSPEVERYRPTAPDLICPECCGRRKVASRRPLACEAS